MVGLHAAKFNSFINQYLVKYILFKKKYATPVKWKFIRNPFFILQLYPLWDGGDH